MTLSSLSNLGGNDINILQIYQVKQPELCVVSDGVHLEDVLVPARMMAGVTAGSIVRLDIARFDRPAAEKISVALSMEVVESKAAIIGFPKYCGAAPSPGPHTGRSNSYAAAVTGVKTEGATGRTANEESLQICEATTREV